MMFFVPSGADEG